MTTIPLGALNKQTGKYVYPGIATKDCEYVCPECNRDLILVKGIKRVHHFRHKVNTINPCMHYDNPGESQIHKDAKLLLKTMLENGVQINILRNCMCCKNNETFEIPALSETSQIILEHRFEHNGPKVADVAYLDSGEIVCIFEICHTHATSANDRPEPWFEIDATALIIDTNNEEKIKCMNIKCIRSEKCEECIEKEKDKLNKKHKALDMLHNWFKTGIEIMPFKYDYADFAEVKIYTNSETTGEPFDIILYVEPNDKFERYCIKLIDESMDCLFHNTREYADRLVGIYYLDMNWVLLQTEMPSRITYVASLDCYNHGNIYKYCTNCKGDWPFWVKRTAYKVIHIGCLGCNSNSYSEYINCERCNSKNTPLCVMETNVISYNICKMCDIDLYGSGYIYLLVSYNSKDEAKQLGAFWDNTYKKWAVHKNHKNADIILKKWKRLW